MNHYPFNPSDYMMATAHLEPLHDLCYRRCLDLYYDTEAPLANAKQSLSKRLRVNEEVLSEVLEEFFEEREDGWHHRRCDREIEKYQAKSEKAKKAGSLGGMAKKAAPEANAKRTLTKRLASASNQNQNQNQNQVLSTEVERAAGRGTKEELVAFALELGLQVSDGEFMFSHWTANGWKNGSSPSKDWKAGMRKWKQAGWMPSQKANGNHPNRTKPVALQRNYLEGLTPEQIGDF